MADWTTDKIPDLTGRIAVVTGATSGIGYWTARVLAEHGAQTVLAVRSAERGEKTASDIRAAHPAAAVSVSQLDVASLASVADFAARMSGELPRIDMLVNNAGLGMQPKRSVTVDGFEKQFGTNHLGHFALTGRLIPLLLQAASPRVVAVASNAHKRGRINFEDLQAERAYNGVAVYAQSKLANLMFALELAAKAREQSSRLSALAAHPGVATTGFMKATAMPGVVQVLGGLAISVLGQGAREGAWPSLYAAAMPDAANGDYWGPDGFMEFRGNPARVKPAAAAGDRPTWQRLWQVSEELTGVQFPPLA